MLIGIRDLGLEFFARVFLWAGLAGFLHLVFDFLLGLVRDNLGLAEGDSSSSLRDI